MSVLFVAIAIGIGVLAGITAGLFGVGGGVIIVPLVVSFFNASQQGASATSLVALLLPVGAFGVWQYWQSGVLSAENFRLGLLIACGLFLGTFLGARIAIHLSSQNLARIFAIFLIFMAAKVWFSAR